MDCSVESSLVLATRHQDGLRTKHFRDLSKNCSTSLRYDPVRESSKKRICGNSREAVRTAALEAHLKFADRHVFTMVILSRLGNLPEEIHAMLHLVTLDLLRFHELHSGFVYLTHKLSECAELIVLTTKSNDENTGSIRVMNHISQNISGVFMVSAELRTSVIMRECYHLLNRRILREFLLELLLNVLSHSVHTSDCRNDPKFVTHACTTVLSLISHEERLLSSRSDFCQFRFVSVLQKALKIGLQIGMIDNITLLYRAQEMTYRESVLDHIGSLLHILKGYLMTCRNRFLSTYINTIDIEALSSLDIMNGNGNIICRIYSYEFHS